LTAPAQRSFKVGAKETPLPIVPFDAQQHCVSAANQKPRGLLSGEANRVEASAKGAMAAGRVDDRPEPVRLSVVRTSKISMWRFCHGVAPMMQKLFSPCVKTVSTFVQK
jgi:hypothetical protein